MPPSRVRRRRLRRTALILVVLGGLLVVALVTAFLALPWLVRKGFEAGARGIESDEASIRVDRADLSGLSLSDVRWRLGGLGVEIDETEAAYSLRALLDGRLASVTVRGLAVTLDFTRPRRGVLPDAIEDLMARFGGGGELVWPVDDLVLDDCRLILGLPDGPHVLALNGTARRENDGRIAFSLQVADSAQQLKIHGRIRTETLDGDLQLERLALEPAVLLDIARQLGVDILPAGMSAGSSGIDISGTTNLQAGVADSFSAQLQLRSAGIVRGTTAIEIASLQLTADQAPGETPSAVLTATVSARDPAAAWSVEPAMLRLELSERRVLGRIDPVGFSAPGEVHGRLGLTVEAGVPALGGAAIARLRLGIDGLHAAGLAFAPVIVEVDGWMDQLELEIPRLALADARPLEVAPLRATMEGLLGETPSARATVSVVAAPSLLQALPDGWELFGLVLPSEVVRLELQASTGPDNGIDARASARSRLPKLRATRADRAWAAEPTLELDLHTDGRKAALTATLAFTSVEAPLPDLPGLPETGSLRVEMPPVSLATLGALAEHRPPEEDVKVHGAFRGERGDQRTSVTISATHAARSETWRVVLDATAEALAGRAAGVSVEQGAGTLSVDTGELPGDVLQAFLDTPSLTPLLEQLVPQLVARVEASAAAVDQPGIARLEWLNLALDKPRSGASEPPLRASLRTRAGNLRMGPETIEQPALQVDLAGNLQAQRVTARANALLDGAPLVVQARQDLATDIAAATVRGQGTFEVEPFSLAHSDIAGRWSPGLKGLNLSASIAAEGTVHFASDGAWDGTAHARLTDGVLTYPDPEVRLDGLFADVAVDSLASMRTRAGQRLGFAQLALADTVVSDAWLLFRTDSASVVHVEGAGFGAFDGVVTAEPFSLYFPDPDVALDLHMRDLDAGKLVRTFDLFDGTLTGRLQGHLPLGLLAGKPILGEGFLELQPEYPAHLSVNAGGLFTSGLPDRTALEKINRLPHELLEDGLSNLQLRHFRIDLFRRDRPDRPIEMLLGGTAHTPRADVPIELKVNLNGSTSEVIDMLLEFLMR